MVKIIKLGREDDISVIVKHIKSTKDRDVVFEVEKGSSLLKSFEGLKLVRKTGDVLGKNVKIETSDPAGRMLAKKAGVLFAADEIKASKALPRAVDRDIKPRFSDIRRPTRVQPKPVQVPDVGISRPKAYEGSRLEIEVAKRSSKFSKIFVLFLVVLVGAVFGLAVLLPKADIKVFARSEPITRDFELTVDKTVTSIDPSLMQIQGIAVSKEVSQTKSFETTGIRSSGTKASGVVVIYNFTANTLKLNAATTTLVAGGKKFSFTKDISGIKPNGEATAGIQIAAFDGGVESNLAAKTRFAIVNAALGNANVYAENPTALSGGTIGAQTKILAQEDVDRATEVLIAEIIKQAETDLTEESGTKMRILDSAVKKEVLAKTANKNVGEAVEKFDMTLIAKVAGLAFKEDHVIELVVSKINEVLSSDKYLLDSMQKNYESSFKSINETLSKGVLAVHFETIAAYKVNADNLPKILAGKNEQEIKEILLSKPEVDNVEVKFWPDWFVHKAPRFNGKINIETVLSQN